MDHLSDHTYRQSIRFVRALHQLAKRISPERLDTNLEQLTVTQLRILGVIKDQPDIAAPDLVQALDMSPAAVTEALKPMVGDSLVSVRPDDDDGSIPRFSLGAQGQRAAYNVEARQIVSMAELLGTLDNEEQGRTVETLERLLDARLGPPDA